jgi:hypothetical protein
MAPFAQTTLPAHKRHPGGRPSEYRQEYCEAVIEHMSKGKSLMAFAGSIRVATDTVYEWIKRHAEFSDAVSRARSARVDWLETKLLASRKGAETTAAIFALRNAAPTEWRDVKYQEHAHRYSVEALTDQQLYAIAAGASPDDVGIIDGSSERLEERDPQQPTER